MIRLFYNYYEDPNPIRKQEIDFCFQKNLSSPYFQTILVESEEKLTFRFLFDQINSMTKQDDINIICNADIFFDETILLANQLLIHEAYALSRWDYFDEYNAILFDRDNSQDTWIIKGPVLDVEGDFYLGTQGCDNRLAYQLKEAGYNPINPAKSIKTYHVHKSAIRNYKFTDAIVPGQYYHIPTSELNEQAT